MGQYETAADWFLRAARAAPALPQTLLGLAACRQLSGDNAAARTLEIQNPAGLPLGMKAPADGVAGA